MISANLRRTVRILYAFSCGYCGVTEVEVGATLTIDHYCPKDAGGTDDINNLVYGCPACNLHKSAAWSPQTPPVLHPLQADMSLHICALDDGTLEGLTPEGKRHIEVRHLNRAPMVERRKRAAMMQTVVEEIAWWRDRVRRTEEQVEQRQRWLRRRGYRNRR